jgi:hypothetical protein
MTKIEKIIANAKTNPTKRNVSILANVTIKLNERLKNQAKRARKAENEANRRRADWLHDDYDRNFKFRKL